MAKSLALYRTVVDVFTIADRTHLGLISAGVAFFGIFALFPAMAALIAVFGLVADPAVVEAQLELMDEIIPPQAYDLFAEQMNRLLSTTTDTLGFATIVSLSIALWSARAGVAALVQGLNAIYGGPNRGGIRHLMVAFALTFALIGVGVAALLIVVIAPIVLSIVPMPAFTSWLLEVIRWVVALSILLVALGILYRYGPNNSGDRMRWITPGALIVVMLWLIASIGFSIYLTNFGRYNEIYGSIGAVIALLMWLYISAYLILMGAALNVVLSARAHQVPVPEHQDGLAPAESGADRKSVAAAMSSPSEGPTVAE